MIKLDEEPYSSSSTSTCDVFLSFRQEDSHDFTNRLHKNLNENEIRTSLEGFVNEDEITPNLLATIKGSSTSIAVISDKYANSRRCLEELSTMILDHSRLSLLLVFYKVDPSHVRHQNGPFEEAFRLHEQCLGKNSETVVRWKKALEKAGGISGYDSRKMDETQLIQTLANEVMTKLSNTPLDVAKHQVGINSRIEEVLKMLSKNSNGVQIMGFHGMGGIGKTTLAKAVYNRLARQFQHCCFISDVRRASRTANGLILLKNKLKHSLFPDSEESFLNKPVVVVLDDVDDVSQLDALVGNRDMYHQRSKMIITTRDRNVLIGHSVSYIYEMKQLNPTESLQLFSYHAFGSHQPVESFKHLTKQFVSHTRGLPLALEVLGSLYFGRRRVNEWEDGLEKLKQIPPGNVHKVLKISFDGLDEQEKCIFLDIACFFVESEMEREYVVDVLKGCGFNAEKAISVLTARCLMKVVSNNTMWMHDLLRDMGRQIVREEMPGDSGLRSRLWDHDEAMTVLKYQKGTENIEGVFLNIEKIPPVLHPSEKPSNTVEREMTIIKRGNIEEKYVRLCTESFAPMVNLRLLQINNASLEGKFKLIPRKLKWLQWKRCPLKELPSDLCASELAVLDLTEGKIEQVWSQRWCFNKVPENLRVLNLLGCYNLNATPDFTGHRHLEKLILERCTGLVKVHKSIGNVKTLTMLNLKDCSNLVNFPNDMSGLGCLETLNLSGCSKFKALPKDLSSMKSLINLLADGTAIKELPDSISHLEKLQRLSLNGCMSLKHLPTSIDQLHSLVELSLSHSAVAVLPDLIGTLDSLLELYLNGCTIQSLPAFVGSLSRLKHLSLGRCRSLDQLPASIGGLTSLVDLQLDNTSIEELPNEIGNLILLEKLELRFCASLSHLPDSIGNMSSLTTLLLVNTYIAELPESIGLLEKLEILNVNKCKRLLRLPGSIGKLKNLHQLQMEDTGVAELPEEFGMISSLMVLKMTKHPDLEKPLGIEDHTKLNVSDASIGPSSVALPASFSNLSLLYDLDARHCKISRIPYDFEKLSSLEVLKLDHNFFSNLPPSLRGLSRLETLSLTYCNKLKCLPPLPSSLSLLDVTNCTALDTVSDLSNLGSLQELRLTNCKNVTDIPGLEKLNSLRRLYMSGCTSCFSAVKRKLPKAAFKNLQNFSIPGSEIPSWLVQEVPCLSHRKNCTIRDVIILITISLQEQNQDKFKTLPAIVDIQAKILRENNPIFTTTLYLLGVPDSDEDQVYLCRFLHYTPLVSLLKEGDKIQITVRNPPCFPGLKLKKYGIALVFEDDDNIEDDDEEFCDETDLSVSAKLEKFFSSSDGLGAGDPDSRGTEIKKQPHQIG